MKRLYSACLKCLQRHITDLPENLPEEKKLAFMQKSFDLLARAGIETSAPVLLWQINRYQREILGTDEDFSPVKTRFNALMLSYEPEIGAQIEAADDPLRLALAYAMLANYIDSGAMYEIDEQYLRSLLNGAHTFALDEQTFAAWKQELADARELLLLTDNCGEIILDKLLLQTVRRLYPQLHITVMVRRDPALNDATREDAEQAGITGQFDVIDNGSGIAGTALDYLSDEAAGAVKRADVILSKGQGNFETLVGCGLNVYYAFLCKCAMFSRRFGVPEFTGMLIRERNLPQMNEH